MDWYSVDRRLAPLFRGAPRQAGSGFWIPAKEPIPLAALLDEALADGDERDEYGGTFDDWPGNVGLVVDGSDARSEGVLSAIWWSGPGLSSAIGLDVVGVEARSYLCSLADYDGEGYSAVACLQPGFADDVVQEVLEQVLLSNGTEVGLTLFWASPPSELSTIASDDVLRRAFERVRDEFDEWGSWEEYLEAGVFR